MQPWEDMMGAFYGRSSMNGKGQTILLLPTASQSSGPEIVKERNGMK